jgi:modified peptide precursor CbpA
MKDITKIAESKRKVIAYRKMCNHTDGTGLSHYILQDKNILNNPTLSK